MKLASKVYLVVSMIMMTSFPAFSHVGDHGKDIYQAFLHFMYTPVHLVAFLMIIFGFLIANILWIRAFKKV